MRDSRRVGDEGDGNRSALNAERNREQLRAPRAAEVDAQRISVEAQGRRVILRGNVKIWVERDEAERAAWAAPGVSDVQNDLRISS
jgi:osmotically-inducible protein OsmY